VLANPEIATLYLGGAIAAQPQPAR
jgi:hypothetical protein